MNEPIGLDVWTTEQLLAEVLRRAAEDAPALRRMHGMILQARLTAHDGERATVRG